MTSEQSAAPITTYSAADIDEMFAVRDVQIAALQQAVKDLQDPPVPPAPKPNGPVVPAGRTLVFVTEFDTLDAVSLWDSPPRTNAAASPTDTGNKALQTPMLASNTVIGADPGASTGSCLQCHVRAGTYALPTGTAIGLTAARCTIGPQFALPGARVDARIRSAGDPGKFAVMIWPALGWHWENDLRERFNGSQDVSCRHHSDLGQPGGAKPQIITPWPVDPTAWHVYSAVYATSDGKSVSGVQYQLDGAVLPIVMPDKTVVQIITDPAWLPNNPTTGIVSIGSAVPPGRTARVGYDAIECVDWVQITRAA